MVAMLHGIFLRSLIFLLVGNGFAFGDDTLSARKYSTGGDASATQRGNAQDRKAEAAAPLPPFKTPQDVTDFCQTYYLKPRPELVATLIEAMPMSGFFKRANALPPFVGFFSEVFTGNPTRLRDWQDLIGKQDEETKAALQQALAIAKEGGAIAINGHSGAIGDLYWGAFFASGNPAYIMKLIDKLKYWDERDNFDLFLAGIAARWSLASNAQSHVLVRSILETVKRNSDKRTQELITELLVQDPVRIKQDARDIIRRQKEAGKWKQM